MQSTETSVTAPAAAEADERLPIVALVGRPNVGKSTLFNRLTRSRKALVAAEPGTTRDRREGLGRVTGYRFRLVDTGGMGFGMALAFSADVERQIGRAVADADVLWMVVDGKEGLNPFDSQLHRWVLRQGKPYRIVVNKLESPARRAALGEFFALGGDALHAVSGAHGLGLDALLEDTARDVPALRVPLDAPTGEEWAGALRVAFVGRPNVGKSSLVNRILGDARMIVSEVPGTTREAVELAFHAFGRDYVLVDTAGIRRRARTTEALEKIGVLQSLGSLNWVHVAVLVVDASDEVAMQDARLASEVVSHRRAVVVALNKWDRVREGAQRAAEVEADIRQRLRFLDFAAFVRTSALEGSGLESLLRAVGRAGEEFGREIQTADLNRMVQATEARTPPPAQGRSPTRLYYGAQVGTEPPSFRFFTNHPKQLDEAYTRFFERQLRHHFGFKGTPLVIDWRSKRRPEDDTRPAATRRKQGAGVKQAPRKARRGRDRAMARGGRS